jgi:L-lysine 2,3-aminomutase
MLVNATQDGGLIDNLFVGADVKVAPVSNVIAKFLNEEANTEMSPNITTSKFHKYSSAALLKTFTDMCAITCQYGNFLAFFYSNS